MPIAVKYIGTREKYFETPVTGKQTGWGSGDIAEVPDADAALLLATLQFVRADAEVLTPADIASAKALSSNAWIRTTDGGIHTLSEVQAVVSATATATVPGACLFRGIVVRAIVGTPQTITVYDATSAAGTPIATFTIAALGTYYWDGDQVTAGNGRGGRRQNTTGCHVVIAGGTSRTIDVMVEAD